MSRASAKGSLRRFQSAVLDPSKAIGLRPDHPAVAEGHTIFPNSVAGSQDSPRFLVSGHNNTKLGAEITKGERAGWPIYHLTLEERATCPRSCAQWLACYGNAMPYARRHAADAGFMDALRAEVLTVARQHPQGFLVRLHTLGDFFSVEYVLLWGELLAKLPQLHAFGYTARREDDQDPQSRKIAKAIRLLTQGAWGRFAIRTSHTEPGRERSIVVDVADPDRPKVIVCPAQIHATETCGTCGLCWSPNAREKTIAFLRHGMKRTREPKPPASPRAASTPSAPSPPSSAKPVSPQTVVSVSQQGAVLGHLRSLADANGEVIGLSRADLAQAARIPAGSVHAVLQQLVQAKAITITKVDGQSRSSNIYRLMDGSAPARPAPAPQLPAVVPTRPAARVPDNMPVNQPVGRRPAKPSPTPAPAAHTPPRRAPADELLMPIDTSPASAGPTVLTRLRAGQCHWPLENSPTGADQLYCAKPCSDDQYCAGHKARLTGRGAK
jgi:hypothetical protein